MIENLTYEERKQIELAMRHWIVELEKPTNIRGVDEMNRKYLEQAYVAMSKLDTWFAEKRPVEMSES